MDETTSAPQQPSPPTPEDSPILMTGFGGQELTHPVVQVWDPFGEHWRGLWRRTSGRPVKAFLDDLVTESKGITGWTRLYPEDGSGQWIGRCGLTGEIPVIHIHPKLFEGLKKHAASPVSEDTGSAPSAEPADRAACEMHNWVPQGDKAVCTECGALGRQP